MNPLMKKLQLKGEALCLVRLPGALDALFPPEAVRTELPPQGAAAVLAFAETREELDGLISTVMPRLAPGAVVWFAYPKKSSRRYRSDITRDTGWEGLLPYDYEPVSQVALDEDWSALRFKPYRDISNPKRAGRMIARRDTEPPA